MIVIKRLTFGPFSENTFVVWDEETKESAVVDPGCFNAEEDQRLKDFVSSQDLTVKYIIATHGHIDHVAGVNSAIKMFKAKFYAPELDVPLIQNTDKQGKAFGFNLENPSMPDVFITKDLKLTLGNSEMEFLFTPGHTPGEHSILFRKEELCITGDVLFKGSIGRTDLWGGDYDTLINSIKGELMTLPDGVIIYPGHGESSKIGLEKKENPFIK